MPNSPPPLQVGFVGLGIMGRGMALNLLKAGFDLTVWNRTAARMDPLVQAGARAATSCGSLAETVDVVFVCVSDTADVLEVVEGDEGLIHGAKAGLTIVDMSTISPEETISLAGRLDERGVRFLDAPVSGGSEGAARGSLSVMIGGEEADVARVMPMLEAMGSRITHVGPVGSGQKVKLVNQMLVVINMLGVSEALLFAQAAGLDLRRTLDAVEEGAAGSWMLSNRGRQCIDRDWKPGFTIDLQQKDLRLVLDSAAACGAPAIATSLCHQLYRTLQRRGLGNDGNHALVRSLEALSGLKVGEHAPS